MADIQPSERKMAPVQGWPQGIPWSLHLEAYAAYCKKWSPQPALIEGWCRGGFGTKELDEFIPGWRERASEIVDLRSKLAVSATDNATLLGEVLALQKAIALAYGHLWSINEEPGTPSPIYTAMQAAYEARKILRGPLTTEQRCNGIDAASAAREVPHG